MSTEGKGKRPYKVWDSGRQIRKGLVASSFGELIQKGREKLDMGEARIRVVLEADGTQVEDPEYFSTLPENTIFLLLRHGEHWYPAGVEALRQASSSSSPRKPSGTARILVSGVGESTHHRQEYLVAQPSVGSTPSPAPIAKSPLPPTGAAPSVGAQIHGTVTTILRDGKKETLINDISAAVSGPPSAHHQGTVINHDSEHKSSYIVGASGASVGAGGVVGRLSRQGSSVDSSHSATVHIHTPKCCFYGHPHTPTPRTARSSPTGEQAECDFHCCALHEEGGRIQVNKTVATSPVQEGQEKRTHGGPPSKSSSIERAGSYSGPGPTCSVSGTVPTTGAPVVSGAGVCAGASAAPTAVGGAPGSSGSASGGVGHSKSSSQVRFRADYRMGSYSGSMEKAQEPNGGESSESETENTTNDEEGQTCEKFLLLTDQLSVETKKHLSIKDIGIILDRLSSKIVDVEKLDRDVEGDDCHNWTIKAVIRGESLRELGVVYNGHYYSISEHPGYGVDKEEEEEEDEEEEERRRAEEEPV